VLVIFDLELHSHAFARHATTDFAARLEPMVAARTSRFNTVPLGKGITISI